MRFAARRARNAAWLYVFRDQFAAIWWNVNDPGNFPRISFMRLRRKQAARGTAYVYSRTTHTAHKLAGLARTCARAEAKGRAL